MEQSKLNEILEKHKHWVNEDCEGGENMRADLRGADLRGAYLGGADLRGAYLGGADLTGADLGGADLTGAHLTRAYLTEADLTRAYLRGAYLRGADLTGADLRGADLRGADLRGADLTGAYLTRAYLTRAYLRGADLTGADLRGAYLRGADLTSAYLTRADLRGADLTGADLTRAKGVSIACPTHGSFIAWKKARKADDDFKALLIKLLIPEDARRSSATSSKCRCDKAKVLEITDLKGIKAYDTAVSSYDDSFIYKVGEMVSADNFCEDRFEECAAGIHFFIDRNEAINY